MIVVTDFGAGRFADMLLQQSRPSEWAALTERLRRRSNVLTALTPYPKRRLPAEIVLRLRVVSWNKAARHGSNERSRLSKNWRRKFGPSIPNSPTSFYGETRISIPLRSKVGASGILLIVMSRYYLNPSWCKDKLAWFSQQIREREAVRVFIVRSQPTDVGKWPERGHAMLGFWFHATDVEVPYGLPGVPFPRRGVVQRTVEAVEQRYPFGAASRPEKSPWEATEGVLKAKEDSQNNGGEHTRDYAASRVFLRYAAQDRVVEEAVRVALIRNSIRVRMAPDDFSQFENWAGAVGNAMRSAQVMVLVFCASR